MSTASMLAYRPLVLQDFADRLDQRRRLGKLAILRRGHAAELLTADARTCWRLGDDPAIEVHLAVLGLARPDGIEAAHGYVTDRRLAADRMQRALVDVEPDAIARLATLEGTSSVSGSPP